MAKNDVTETNKFLRQKNNPNVKPRRGWLRFFNRRYTAATGAAVAEDEDSETETERNLDRRTDDEGG